MNRIQSNNTHIQHTSLIPAHRPPSAVHDPTASFNPFLLHPNISSPFCHLITKIGQSLHCHICPPSGTNSHQYCEKYLTHPANSPKRHLLTLGTYRLSIRYSVPAEYLTTRYYPDSVK